LKRQIDLVSREMPIHCVELTNRGVYTKTYDTARIPLPKIASDDAHSVHECGQAWVEVRSPQDPDSILRAIKQGDFRNRYKLPLSPR
jgi:hypothetical protein